ncbi:unnamed protein product, partial [Nesidiocoris tenuis]
TQRLEQCWELHGKLEQQEGHPSDSQGWSMPEHGNQGRVKKPTRKSPGINASKIHDGKRLKSKATATALLCFERPHLSRYSSGAASDSKESSWPDNSTHDSPTPRSSGRSRQPEISLQHTTSTSTSSSTPTPTPSTYPPWQMEQPFKNLAAQHGSERLLPIGNTGRTCKLFLRTSRSTSPRRLCKQVALESPPPQLTCDPDQAFYRKPSSHNIGHLHTLNSKKTLPDALPTILHNVACYLDCLPLEAGLVPSASAWAALLTQLDLLFRRLSLQIQAATPLPLLRIMLSVLRVPGIASCKVRLITFFISLRYLRPYQLSAISNPTFHFQSILDPFAKVLGYSVQNFVFKYQYLVDLCYLCNRAFSRVSANCCLRVIRHALWRGCSRLLLWLHSLAILWLHSADESIACLRKERSKL